MYFFFHQPWKESSGRYKTIGDRIENEKLPGSFSFEPLDADRQIKTDVRLPVEFQDQTRHIDFQTEKKPLQSDV